MTPSSPSPLGLPGPARRYDVVVLGGAFSGAAAAVLLRRDRPSLSVLVVERAAAFDEKVGEATTEMSAMFLTRRLALWEHLERQHLPKEGLRYWFQNDRVKSHAEASETGAYLRSAVPSFQLRRDTLDEHLLSTAAAEGAEVMRPARVVDVALGAPGERDHLLTIERSEREAGPGEPDDPPAAGPGGPSRGRATETVACRWLLDASGRACFLGRRLGLVERNDEHPTAAVWCRWRGVRHIDDLAARGPLSLSRANIGSRRLGTNHYMGFGYWVWVIPLGNGETSIGVVFDTRLVDLDRGAERREAEYLRFLQAIPSLAELLQGATPRSEDLRTFSNLAYRSGQYMGPGWALVGDAAAFLDPYYSPGLDHAAFSVEATVAIVTADSDGEDVAARIATHNETFARSYDRFFRAVYLDKYYYMGEHDLLSASTLLDTAQYYLFVVIPAYRIYGRFHWMPVLGPREAFLSYHLMRLYNRRFKSIALARRAAGEEGRRNDRRRVSLRFDLQLAPLRMVGRGMKIWLRAELDLVRLHLGRALGGRRRGRLRRDTAAELRPDLLPEVGPARDRRD